MTARKVRCPQCGEPVVWGAESPWRPFCSERCKLIGLGCWAAEAYRVPAVGGDSEDGDTRPEVPRDH
ncbi:MAG TPA: DNA gyrase inhibitor YacG [Rhodocyclaceae bacterium]|nr:DNA gyrase inhibitor YacG [Rhodocyclaceae bacterium]